MQNDFLPISIAPGNPAFTQPEWVAETPAAGRGPGILPKEWYNKAARQSSVMAAALGALINEGGEDALDDGNIPALTLALKTALSAALTSRTHYALATNNGAAVAQNVVLVPGTWQVKLDTRGRLGDPTEHSVNGTVAQAAHLDTTTVNTNFALTKNASDTNTTHGTQIRVGTLVVPPGSPVTVTMSMDAVVLTSDGQPFVSQGSEMTIDLLT